MKIFIVLLCGSLWNRWICNFKGVIINYHPHLRHKLTIIGGKYCFFFPVEEATMH